MKQGTKPASPSASNSADHLLTALFQKELQQFTHQEKFNFLIEEYRMLRTELESYSKQKRQLEISVITAILFIYGWVAVAKLDIMLYRLILITPAVIVLWGIYRFIFYNKVINKEIQYIKERIENVIVGEEGGWEFFWEKAKTGTLLRRTEYVFWIMALLITLTMPFLLSLYKAP